MGSLSESEMAMLRALLHRAQADGTLTALLSPSSDDGWSLPESPDEEVGAMTDGSKRRLCSPATRHRSSGASTQMPMMPVRQVSRPVIELPEGVSSVQEWGATLIDFGKYKGTDTTYEELVDLTKKDQNAKSYLDWVSKHGKTSTGPVKDLYLYLVAVRYTSTEGHGPLIPGTNTVRRRRDTGF